MFTTKSAQSLKNLFAGYHEPTALSRQQSQKLLDGLKTSFRKQLDREYGHIGSGPNVVSAKGADAAEVHRRSAANQHLKAVLTNPLFAYNKDPVPKTIASLPSVARDPMDVFEEASEKGLMNLQAATGCLMAKRKQMRQNSTDNRIGAKETAQRVLHWLRISPQDIQAQFMDNHKFIRTLMPFLVEGGFEDTAWEWLAMTLDFSNETLSKEQLLSRSSVILTQLVRHKRNPQFGGLDDSISTVLQAEKTFANNSLLANVLIPPWREVSWMSTVEAFRSQPASESMFDAHLDLANRLPQTLRVESAHLHLHHPVHPDSSPAMKFFEDKEPIRELLQGLAPGMLDPVLGTFKKLSMPTWIAFLGQDTIDSLTQCGRNDEAQDVTELLQTRLPKAIAPTLQPA